VEWVGERSRDCIVEWGPEVATALLAGPAGCTLFTSPLKLCFVLYIILFIKFEISSQLSIKTIV
jgi:hypothetical protein